MQQKSWRYAKKRGFLYLDLMIALVTLSVCVITLGRSLSAVTAIIYTSNKRVKGLNLATQLLDYCIAKHAVNAPYEADVDGYTVTFNHHRIKLDTAQREFCQVSVTVAWSDMNGCCRKLSLADGYFDEQNNDA